MSRVDLRDVAKAWADEVDDPGAGRSRLGWLAMSLVGWRWVTGMTPVPCGKSQDRLVYLGTAPNGTMLAAKHTDGTRRIVDSYFQGAAVDVLDTATAYLMLSLLHPQDHSFVQPVRGSWCVMCVPMLPPLNNYLPLGVAVLAVAAERGGWGVDWHVR